MSWARFDDRFWSHPKVLQAGNAAVGAFARAVCYCSSQHTDGFVSDYMARFIGAKAQWDRLVASGLVERVEVGQTFLVTDRRDSGNRVLEDVTVTMPDQGYFIEDFLHFNLTKAEAEVRRRRRQSAGALGGQASAQASASADAKQVTVPPARPGPIEGSKSVMAVVTEPPVEKLIDALGDIDAEACDKIRGFARRLPESSVAKVLESVRTQRPRSRVAYAIGALSSELRERGAA